MYMIYHCITDRVGQKNNLMYIGPQGKTILGIIILNLIQRNIAKICAHLSYIRLIA
jgi:hypothetical protein